MIFLDPEHSKIEKDKYNRNEDFIVDYIDDVHVRFMKLFPMCHLKSEVPYTDYRRFHIRFYIPREIYFDRSLKVERVFILLNGLDELKYFTLYDQLGHGLAEYGYASILLPLPSHLNRSGECRYVDKVKEWSKPSDFFINEREIIYKVYKQVIDEIQILTDHIKCKAEQCFPNKACDFYRQFFNKKTKISILGYSIGGLAALSMFLLKKDLFNSCILMNSGSKLDSIDVSYFIPLEKWKETVDKLHKDWEFNLDNSLQGRLFEKIFLGNKSNLLRIELKDVSRKILFILGGADTVTKYESIRELEKDDYGLTILQLPGIHHFLSFDNQWNKWFKMVINIIAQFDDNATRESLTYYELLEELITYHKKFNIFDDQIDLSSENFEANEFNKISRIIYAIKSGFINTDVAKIEMYKHINRIKRHPKLFSKEILLPEQKLIGELAIEKFKLGRDDIHQLLEIQKEHALSGDTIPKFGELMVSKNIITEDNLKDLMEELNNYDTH